MKQKFFSQISGHQQSVAPAPSCGHRHTPSLRVVADCHKCSHYFVTWQINFPHGCRAMGFKSRRLPNLDVRRAMQGKNCLAYQLKTIKKAAK